MNDRKIASLQVLRGVAALMVVSHHARRAVSARRPEDLVYTDFSIILSEIIELGSVGVDLFFVLSGFLMLHIAEPYFRGQRSVFDFLLQRVVRIWPLYLVATFVALIPALATLVRTGVMGYDLTPYRLLGLVFVPTFNANGGIQPILGVGWTLSYEFLFYLAFAAILPFGRPHALVRLAAVLLALHGVGQILGSSAMGHFLRSDLLLEFFAGGTIAILFQRGLLRFGTGAALIAAGGVLLLGSTLLPASNVPRAVAFGVPACLAFTGFLTLEGRVAWPSWLLLVGDASYALYLFHTLLLYRVANAVMRPLFAHGHPEIGMVAAFAAAVLTALVVGIGAHFAIERRLQAIIAGWLRENRNANSRKSVAPPSVAGRTTA
jgi:exopolysaccharide production protein ExoZ